MYGTVSYGTTVSHGTVSHGTVSRGTVMYGRLDVTGVYCTPDCILVRGTAYYGTESYGGRHLYGTVSHGTVSCRSVSYSTRPLYHTGFRICTGLYRTGDRIFTGFYSTGLYGTPLFLRPVTCRAFFPGRCAVFFYFIFFPSRVVPVRGRVFLPCTEFVPVAIVTTSSFVRFFRADI